MNNRIDGKSVSVGEATPAREMTFSLSEAQISAVTADWSTADGTAIAGEDYVGSSGSILFAPGGTSKTVSVPILDDSLNEATESFFVPSTTSSV
jgi:hypothetical protein